MLSDLRISNLLEGSIDASDIGWTLCFIGESQQTKLAELVQEIKGGFSETGDCKRIVSGFSYWGIGPTISWAKTCSDPFYPVMTGSIRSFRSRWRELHESNIAKKKFHYVSLGVGTGKKDRNVIADLLIDNPDLLFFPVDMSSTMLRMAIQEVMQIDSLKGSQILPIQLDFSDTERIRNLRDLIDQLVPDAPILFSLLGNTLANFQYDEKLLRILSRLVRKDDLLLIEVASTKRLDEQIAQQAAREYANTESFRKFVASALLQNTNLHIDLASVLFKSSVENDKSILIKIIYQNTTGENLSVMLPDWSSMDLVANDTIRLLLTR
ncbi:MAG: L-histidine N(alpha)-methyltransferase [Leptolyngbyaceae cyanobacterium]